MPSKGHIAKRGMVGDPVFGSDLVTKFVNSMMWQGKKSTAQGIFYTPSSVGAERRRRGSEAV